MNDLISREYAIRRFGEDGTFLERNGVTTMSLVDAKQRAIDLLESFPAKLDHNAEVGKMVSSVQPDTFENTCEIARKSNDCISRQQALEYLGERPEVFTESDYELGCRNQYDVDRLAITCVPSAQPKTGKWEAVKRSDGVTIDFRCSSCHRFRFHNGELRRYKFCPECGAKMAKEGDEHV